MLQTPEARRLGASGIDVPPLGVGTNRWGAAGRAREEIFQTFQAALTAGINLLDTAEIYTRGNSERLIGECMRRDARTTIVCTKFAPLPTRLSAKRLLQALDVSLERLQARSIDVYYLHFPFTLLSIDALIQAMAQAYRSGKIRAVGVSNYSAQQMREAAACLAPHGIALAANEVHYSLLHRRPEVNGVLEACRELDVALVAYYPLGAGQLIAPAARGQAPAASSWMSRLAARYICGASTPEQLRSLQTILANVAAAHGGTASQAALNWLLQRDEHVIAIPGATRVAHVRENAAALLWRLTTDEFAAIDQASLPWKR